MYSCGKKSGIHFGKKPIDEKVQKNFTNINKRYKENEHEKICIWCRYWWNNCKNGLI